MELPKALRTRARARLLKRSLSGLWRPTTSGPTPLLTYEQRDAAFEEYTDKLCQLVKVDSSTSNIYGINQVQNFMSDELRQMGFEIEFKSNSVSESGDFLLADLAPSGAGKYVTLIAHADTVLPPFDDPYVLFENGRKARGSGIIDNKGGLLVVLLGLKLFLKEVPRPNFSLRCAISPNEEVGSVGFIDLYNRLSEDTAFALGFEPSLDDGSIIESRRGNRWYSIKVTGLSAHAGRSKGHHVNAAHELARKIYLLEKLNDEKKDISVNIGGFQGGSGRYNVICGEARAQLDVRFSDFQGRDQVHRAIERILAKRFYYSSDHKHWAKTEYDIVDDCPPFSVGKLTREHLKGLTKIIQQLEGEKINSCKAGGAGDVNHLSRQGVIVIDGLGARGGNMHTSDEFMYLPSLVTRAEALALFLKQIHKTWKTS